MIVRLLCHHFVGPFGFMEKYNPYWNMWIGGGKHFSFQNQPVAGQCARNRATMCTLATVWSPAAFGFPAPHDLYKARAPFHLQGAFL